MPATTPWNTLSVDQMIAEGGFSISEKTQLTTSAGTNGAALADVLDSVIQTVRGVVAAAGGTVDVTSGSIPDSLRMDIIAIIRWRWLTGFPNLVSLQTEPRKLAADLAEKRLDEVAKSIRPIEPPEDSDVAAGGNWGSETKIAMRTSDGGTGSASS